ncbi:TPA: transcriptional regulator [Vibrio cholerae]
MVSKSNSYTFGMYFILEDCLEFHPYNSKLIFINKIYPLSHTETRILEILIKNCGNLVNKDEIIEHSWTGRIVAETSLSKSISNIRKIFKECGISDDAIQTIPRLGYRLNLNIKEIENNEAMTELSYIEDKKAPKKTRKITLSHPFLQYSFYILGGIMLLISILRIEHIFHKKDFTFLNINYEKDAMNVADKKYTVIRNKEVMFKDTLQDLISLSPSGSTVFYNENGDIINISYLVNNHAISFTFSKEEISKARCVIKSAIVNEKHVCAL